MTGDITGRLEQYEKAYSEEFVLNLLKEQSIYAGRKYIDNVDVHQEIYKLLSGTEPAMIGRFGGNEKAAFFSGISDPYPYHFWKKRKKFQEHWGMFYGAGFFPKNINLMPDFAQEMIEACKQIDMIAVWKQKYEDFLIEEYCKEDMTTCALLTLGTHCNPDNSWTRALKGKKVLVVHPYKETILSQYEKREKLFKNSELLPEMDLMVMKSVQTIAGERDSRFKNWFEALDYMHQETRKYDYEIAVVGCGAYGFPLAARMKKDGKKVIHLGGVTQCMFGIMGNRWKDDRELLDVINPEYWVRPSLDETPKNPDIIEHSCYW